MIRKETFQQVLVNSDDQVAVREILHNVLTREQQDEVVSLFNERIAIRNQIRKDLGI